MSYSELERLSFNQLYERYDSSRDESEKIRIQQVVVMCILEKIVEF